MLMLLDCPPRRILRRFWPLPLPPAGTFDGKTVLIVGGTSGIGLAAAVHFATLSANVIITYRVASRGEAAKRHIENKVGSAHKGRISSLMLDMERYDSCTNFVDELKRTIPGPEGLDVAILNAGMINSHYEQSPEDWEKTIQVNTISTTLVGLLLSEWMRSGRDQRSSPAHLIFVTSRDHLYPDIRQFARWAETKEGILRQVSSKENWLGVLETEPNYANSKLLVMYTIEEISKRALGPGGEPLVIVNSLCPGLVRTGIGRNIASRSWFLKAVIYVYLAVVAKSPDHGSRFCVTVALKPKENHGEFFNFWLTANQYHKHAVKNVTSGTAREIQKLVWKDVIGELRARLPRLQTELIAI
ncbi:hypothetical protein F5Y01DRAFT_277334 [Xylaria sp. FL0043]|nr:hypothetical protein F5Y01DRAFT_277334 [Xylaria sp. FL0043]